MKAQAKTSLGRRRFFQALGIGAAAAAAPLAREAAAEGVSNEEKRKAQYRESEEVKTYYRVNRYPSSR